MASNPKLEVFKIELIPQVEQHKTFRDFFSETLNIAYNQSNAQIFNSFFQDFIRKIDTDNFIDSSRKKKAFTAYNARNDDGSIRIHSESTSISGVVEGGRYGKRRNKSKLTNKEELQDIEINDIILDKFFFCLYTPFNYDVGILMIQSYSSDSITDIFTDFLQKYFKKDGLYKKAKIERFFPQHIIEQFKEHSNIDRFTFSKRFLVNQLSDEPYQQQEEEFVVKIEVVSKQGLPKNTGQNWLKTFEQKIFDNVKLSSFPSKKGYLKNEHTKKTCSFEIDDNEIRPVIYLENEGIEVGLDGLPNFSQLETFCKKLLKERIIPEIFPS
jgi:hypothetical protein